MFELEVFRKQIYSIEESNCDIVASCRRPRSDLVPQYRFGARGIVPPLPPPRYAPACSIKVSTRSKSQNLQWIQSD